MSGPDNQVKNLKIVTRLFLWRKILLLALKKQELPRYDMPLESPIAGDGGQPLGPTGGLWLPASKKMGPQP